MGMIIEPVPAINYLMELDPTHMPMCNECKQLAFWECPNAWHFCDGMEKFYDLDVQWPVYEEAKGG